MLTSGSWLLNSARVSRVRHSSKSDGGTVEFYLNLPKPNIEVWEPRREGSAGAESDETPHAVFAWQTASHRVDARRAQLRGLSGANRAQRAEQTFQLSHRLIDFFIGRIVAHHLKIF